MWVQVSYNGMAASIRSERPVTLALWMLEQVDHMRAVCASASNFVHLDIQATSELEAELRWPEPATYHLDSLINLAAMIEASLSMPAT
jgi:hypothetical protein